MGVALPFDLADLGDGHALTHEFFLCGEGPEGSPVPVRIEVFVEAVDYEFEEFLGVLLAIDAPFAVETRAEIAEGGRADGLDVVFPEGANEIGVDFGHDAVGAFPVLLGEVAPAVVEKELGEGDSGEEALDGCVHVAGDAEVDQACAGKFEVLGDSPGGVERRLDGWRLARRGGELTGFSFGFALVAETRHGRRWS